MSFAVTEEDEEESDPERKEDEEDCDSESEEDANCCVWRRTGSSCCAKGKICTNSK